MDHEGSGDGIDAGDLKQALQRHGIRVTIVQAAQLIKEIDDDGNGSINFEEFFEAVQAHFERQYNKELTNDLIAEKESATMAAARAGLASQSTASGRNDGSRRRRSSSSDPGRARRTHIYIIHPRTRRVDAFVDSSWRRGVSTIRWHTS